jgi:ubiquitin carboxyl-terminal hydrolase 4/11/15
VTSGRANSLTGYGINTPVEAPGVAPGFFILGPVPAIIRCWLDTNFKHDTLLYAAVCSGSCASYLDSRLIDRLGFQDCITTDEGVRKLKLTVYLPEAIPTRSSSPAPQLPSLCVEFNVLERGNQDEDSKAIQIILGSDVLRAHNGDILFSTNNLTLYDDEGTKLQIPLVRPEDEGTFKYLLTSSADSMASRQHDSMAKDDALGPGEDMEGREGVVRLNGGSMAAAGKPNGILPISRPEQSAGESGNTGQRPFLGISTGSVGSREAGTDSNPTSAAPHSGTSPAIWSNWRRDTEKPSNLDWPNGGKDASLYQRRDAGIKVLKPMKPLSRSLSSGAPQGAGAVAPGHSRFFDDGKRRVSNVDGNNGTAEPQPKRSVSGEKGKEVAGTSTKARTANPVGGASAFAWLKSGDAK